ncbi:MAG TPA: DNA-directed RNA polymerase subunit beta' [Phycisphaerae bacterium]|nr:DNA-directed RNA polymerase subunit beta' [Phycisphaerae bacterium]
MAETIYDRINDYGAVKIALASPNDIRSWSFGEVKKPETINYRTYRPERDGLFCERIFGPERDWECACGKYKGTKYKGIICDRCGVKVTHSRVRRKRMGHINLAAPVVHIWFFKAMPSRLGNLLDMKTSDLEKVVYYQDYMVVDPGTSTLKRKQLLTEEEYREAREKFGDGFKADMGAEAVRTLLTAMDLSVESNNIREGILKTNSKQKIKDYTKRLKIVEAIRNSENKSEWMIYDVIPVIPPDLRPLVLLESGNFATSDLNDLYRRIINRNNRLKKLVDLNAPEVIIRNEKRMLQQAVDALFDNGRCRRPVLGSSNRPLKSLTDMIKGKQGRFRENLLGKRVDYSARSVIVVGPELKIHQCGLPKKIALELYQPFIIRKLKEHGLADTIKSAKKMIERRDKEIWDILEEVIKGHPVLLNRAPTLHRMGIQAFEPVLIEGNAIKIHPLVCKGFNADFDGDQMAVHLPLSVEAQAEAHILMLSTHNIFSPASGSPIIGPSQDIVLGIYYLTVAHRGEVGHREPGKELAFRDIHEALLAYHRKQIGMHTLIKVRIDREHVVSNDSKPEEPTPANKVITTTIGRLIFNDILPKGMPFYNTALSAKGGSRVIADAYKFLGRPATIDLLDNMKELGFKNSTLAGLSFAITDLRIPAKKQEIIDAQQKKADRVEKNLSIGAITERERYNALLDIWSHARNQVTDEMMIELKEDTRDIGGRPLAPRDPSGIPYLNPVALMADSKARGSVDNFRQLSGMRGLMSRPSGEIMETPIKTNFREGLSVLEYFTSTHGARKGLADTALKTADSGYLTRKLADVAQNVIVSKHDCGTQNGIRKSAIYKGEQIDVPLREAILGRCSSDTIINPITDEVIVREGQIITETIATKIENLNIETVRVRSPLTCESPNGVCAKCYGVDLSTGKLVEEGLATGIIAAQSIGEPGTQLTMRTFHTGGVGNVAATKNDIRAGAAGIVEYRDLNAVDVADHEGNKHLVVLKRNGFIAVVDAKGRELERQQVPYGATLLAKEKDAVKGGQQIAVWDPHRIPILAEKAGRIEFQDIEEGETVRAESEGKGGVKRLVVVEHKGERHPQIKIVDPADGKILDFHFLPAKARIDVDSGQLVVPGHLLARQPKESKGTSDITSGLPRVTEIFEARKPKDPAIMAEISGSVEIQGDKRRGKQTIIVRGEGGIEKEHHVPQASTLRVHTGDTVDAGDPLIEGPHVPHDILRIKGEDALQNYLLAEVQNVYRTQNQKISDKHIEIIISQMLRKVKVENPGDTKFLPGEVVDKFRFRYGNEALAKMLKIDEPGDSGLSIGQVVSRDELKEINAKVEEKGGTVAKGKRPRMATAKTLLLGITKASLQSESFVSAASFQETTKVLTEAAIAGKEDTLVGLKENVILGHLIPAGTAFKPYLDMTVGHYGTPVEEPEAEIAAPAPEPAPTVVAPIAAGNGAALEPAATAPAGQPAGTEA